MTSLGINRTPDPGGGPGNARRIAELEAAVRRVMGENERLRRREIGLRAALNREHAETRRLRSALEEQAAAAEPAPAEPRHEMTAGTSEGPLRRLEEADQPGSATRDQRR